MILALILAAVLAAESTPTPCPNDGPANCWPTPVARSCESRLEQCEQTLLAQQRQREVCRGQLERVMRNLAPELFRTPQPPMPWGTP